MAYVIAFGIVLVLGITAFSVIAVSKVSKMDKYNNELEQKLQYSEHILRLMKGNREHEPVPVSDDYDRLTGLPNRRLFLSSVSEALKASRDRKSTCAIMIVGINDFELLEDGYGREVGNIILRHMSERIHKTLEGTNVILSRIGVDEFSLFCGSSFSYEDIVSLADNVMSEVERPYHLKQIDIVITATIGIAIHPIDGLTEDQLMKRADNAMYEARKNGKEGHPNFPQMLH